MARSLAVERNRLPEGGFLQEPASYGCRSCWPKGDSPSRRPAVKAAVHAVQPIKTVYVECVVLGAPSELKLENELRL